MLSVLAVLSGCDSSGSIAVSEEQRAIDCVVERRPRSMPDQVLFINSCNVVLEAYVCRYIGNDPVCGQKSVPPNDAVAMYYKNTNGFMNSFQVKAVVFYVCVSPRQPRITKGTTYICE